MMDIYIYCTHTHIHIHRSWPFSRPRQPLLRSACPLLRRQRPRRPRAEQGRRRRPRLALAGVQGTRHCRGRPLFARRRHEYLWPRLYRRRAANGRRVCAAKRAQRPHRAGAPSPVCVRVCLYIYIYIYIIYIYIFNAYYAILISTQNCLCLSTQILLKQITHAGPPGPGALFPMHGNILNRATFVS